MKTFSELMEQIHGAVDRTEVALAKTQANAAAERLRRRRQYQHGLHTTMHLRDTAAQEKQGMKG